MLIGVGMLAAALSSTLLIPSGQRVVAAPGTPGTPQPPTTVLAEDFQNRPGPTPIARLTAYSSVGGQTYTAAAQWLAGCNGWIASANEATTSVGGAATQVTDCASQGNWNAAQQLAQALGIAAGQTAVVARNNYAVSAYTANSPAAGAIEFQTATNVPFITSNRFITFSADVAAVNCAVAPAPILQFSLLNDVSTVIPVGAAINACTSPRTVTVPALGALGAVAARVGTYTANGSVLITGSSIGVRMVNVNGGGGGNDHAFDNISILDVTPQLDKSFTPSVVGVGQPTTLTLTVTNTNELASKNGWSFTDNLSAGLTVSGAPTTTCPSGTVTAPLGATAVAVTGNLSAGMASCVVRVNVTSNTVGTFTNGPANISPRAGVNPPGSSTVSFTEAPALSIVKSSTAVTIPAVGQLIPYQFLVTNTGNVTMHAIDVTDPNTTGVIACPVTNLTPGTSTTCTGSHTVTQADIDAGAVVNTATVVGTPPLGAAISVPSNRLTILANQLPGLSIVKSSTTVTIPAVGQTIPYDFLVSNTGNVTITGIDVTDANTGIISCPTTTLAPAAATTCTGTHIVTQADLDAGQVVNRASVVGNRPGGRPIPSVPSNQLTIAGLPNPALSIVKSSTTAVLPVVGATIPYTFSVTNVGDVTMTGITVTDDKTGPVTCPPTPLTPGAALTCTATYTVTQADVDAGGVVNQATVVGTPPFGAAIAPVTSNEISVAGVSNPRLAIVKASTTTAVLDLGQVVPYTFEVTNIGNVTMNAITVTDPDATDIFCPAFSLAPGTATTCTAIHTVTQPDLDAGELVNQAAVVGTPPAAAAIASVASNEITIPVAQIESLALRKTTATALLPVVGTSVPYELAVTNNGNVTITDIDVTDAHVATIACPVTTLTPGEVTTCTASHIVTQADVDAGTVVNTAVVVGTPPDGTPIPTMPSNEVTVTGARNPALSIVKASTTTAITTAGQALQYTFTITNTGNVTVTNIAVDDPITGPVACPQTTLAPGTATVCTGNYTATAADLDDGQVVNTAAVTGTPPGGGTPLTPTSSNTVTIPVASAPSLSILKSTTTAQVSTAGETVPFTFLVTNTGNVTISHLTVTDPLIAHVSCPRDALPAGGSTSCTGDYTTTAADVAAGQIVNTATVTGTPPNGPPIDAVASNQVVIPIPTPATTPDPPDAGQLPATGTDSSVMLQITIILTSAGIALTALARRRRTARR